MKVFKIESIVLKYNRSIPRLCYVSLACSYSQKKKTPYKILIPYKGL